jgi:thiol-disulfide isomerase/thioredoxin
VTTSGRYNSNLMVLVSVLLLSHCLFAVRAISEELTVEDAYPYLATGILKNAKLADLDGGVVLISEGMRITESDLQGVLENASGGMRDELERNLFFLLEQQATQKILIQAAKKSQDQGDQTDTQAVKNLLNEKTSSITVSVDEMVRFYEDNKDQMGGATFDQVKETVQNILLQQKKGEAIRDFVTVLGRGRDVFVDAEWVKKQNILSRDNPVDQARSSGKPTMVEFGASGCKPCDMMQPILQSLREKYRDRINVVFAHVREQPVLGARYGISSIPIQVFFDEQGKEVMRHVGFLPQGEIVRQLAAMGVQ